MLSIKYKSQLVLFFLICVFSSANAQEIKTAQMDLESSVFDFGDIFFENQVRKDDQITFFLKMKKEIRNSEFPHYYAGELILSDDLYVRGQDALLLSRSTPRRARSLVEETYPGYFSNKNEIYYRNIYKTNVKGAPKEFVQNTYKYNDGANESTKEKFDLSTFNGSSKKDYWKIEFHFNKARYSDKTTGYFYSLNSFKSHASNDSELKQYEFWAMGKGGKMIGKTEIKFEAPTDLHFWNMKFREPSKERFHYYGDDFIQGTLLFNELAGKKLNKLGTKYFSYVVGKDGKKISEASFKTKKPNTEIFHGFDLGESISYIGANTADGTLINIPITGNKVGEQINFSDNFRIGNQIRIQKKSWLGCKLLTSNVTKTANGHVAAAELRIRKNDSLTPFYEDNYFFYFDNNGNLVNVGAMPLKYITQYDGTKTIRTDTNHKTKVRAIATKDKGVYLGIVEALHPLGGYGNSSVITTKTDFVARVKYWNAEGEMEQIFETVLIDPNGMVVDEENGTFYFFGKGEDKGVVEITSIKL